MVRPLNPMVLMAAVMLGGCASKPTPAGIAVVVFAASSLTEVFHDMERGFEQVNPDVDVQLTFAGSQVLRLQLEHGASADVFASADASHMQALAEAGLIARSEVFAGNELALIVPRENPAGIESFYDLPRAARLVIGTENVPVGIYTRELLRRADPEFASQVRRRVVSEESNARLVRAKVALGEADAAIVYRTDAVASDLVRFIPIPESLNVTVNYHVGLLREASQPKPARRWTDYLRSEAGRAILSRRGFVAEP